MQLVCEYACECVRGYIIHINSYNDISQRYKVYGWYIVAPLPCQHITDILNKLH